MTEIQQLTPLEANMLVQTGAAVLLDVREIDEYQIKRIPGVLLFPLSTWQEIQLPVLAKGQVLIFHCGVGGRSQRAAEAAVNAGYEFPVANLAGGIEAWEAAKLPLILAA